MKKTLAIVMLAAITLVIASAALAQEHGAAPAEAAAPAAAQIPVTWKALGAALAIGLSAFATAWAQSKIGSAAAGAIAERPETAINVIILEALPETIILLGFVIAVMIIGMK